MLSNKKSFNQLITNSILAALVLLFFIIVAVSIHLFSSGKEVSLTNIFLLPRNVPLLKLIYLLPFVGGFSLFIIGRLQTRRADELEMIIEREQVKTKQIHDFINRLKDGDIETQYEIENEFDSLGQALVNLRDSLRRSKDEELARRKEDRQRNWATEGFAKFGEILRRNPDNLEALAFDIIQNLVNYINVNQGGFYILQSDGENEAIENKYYELMACLAFERRKYRIKRIEWGEGLIGRSGMEKRTIYLTDVPSDYINITSGLGDATPRSVLIVPLIVNEEIHGVIELASFSTFQPFEIDFVERLSEITASTIANVKINLRTSHLLRDSQIQGQKLAKQEEAMRKNMGELRKTQKEAAKQSEQFVSFTNSVNHTLIRAEYDIRGKLLYANTKFLTKLGYSSNQEIEGRHISMFINPKDQEWFNDIWVALAKGGRHFEDYMKHVTKNDMDLWTMATYTCVRNMDGSVEKILFLAIDTTEEKQKSLDYIGQIEALNRSTIKVAYAPDGRILDANEKYFNVVNYSLVELRDKSVFHLFDRDAVRDFKDIWEDVLRGKPFEGQICQFSQIGEEKWMQATYTAVNDMYGDVAKVIFIANDITEQKQIQLKANEQTQMLKKQEEELKEAQADLSLKLEDAKVEMEIQYKEIALVKTRHEKTLEGALDAIVTVSSDGIIQFFNQAAEDLWGIAKKDVVGQNLRILLPENMSSLNNEFITNYLENKMERWVGLRSEINVTNADNEEIPVLITVSQARLENDNTFTAFIQNVSIELF